MTLDVRSLACGDRDVCEKGGELSGLIIHWKNLPYWRET